MCIRDRLYTDTMITNVVLYRKKTYCQVWSDGAGYTLVYPIVVKSEGLQTASQRVTDLKAIPMKVVLDGSGEQAGN